MLDHQYEEAVRSMRAAEAEVEELRAKATRALDGKERESWRAEEEAKQKRSLQAELDASEARREAQDREISLVRDQVRYPMLWRDPRGERREPSDSGSRLCWTTSGDPECGCSC